MSQEQPPVPPRKKADLHVLTEEEIRRFRPHISVQLGKKRYELNPPAKPEKPGQG